MQDLSRYYINQNGEALEIMPNHRDYLIGPIEWSPNVNQTSQLLSFSSSNFLGP